MSKISDPYSAPIQGRADSESAKRRDDGSDRNRDLEKEAKDFADRLNTSDKKARKKETSGGLAQGEKQGGSLGSSILQSMQGPGADASIKTENGSSLTEITQVVADKVLVSEVNGKDEIRIMLKDSVMADTEVRISKESGMIKVELVTASEESFRFLAAEKAGLEQKLMDRIKDPVSVQVNFNETDQGDNQGRSRQQRDLYEEQEEE